MRQSKLLAHLDSPQLSRRNARKAARIHAYVNESSGGSSDEDIAAIPLEPEPEPSRERSQSSEEELKGPSPQKPSSPLKRAQRICLSDDDSASSPYKPSGAHLSSHSGSDSEENLPRKGKLSRAAILDSDEDIPKKKPRLSKGVRPDSPEPDPTEELDDNGTTFITKLEIYVLLLWLCSDPGLSHAGTREKVTISSKSRKIKAFVSRSFSFL
jgi:hypothetical protein